MWSYHSSTYLLTIDSHHSCRHVTHLCIRYQTKQRATFSTALLMGRRGESRLSLKFNSTATVSGARATRLHLNDRKMWSVLVIVVCCVSGVLPARHLPKWKKQVGLWLIYVTFLTIFWLSKLSLDFLVL